VISFIGLGTEQQKQNFVSQLEMELFAWLRMHPAGERPLGALLVIDEAQTVAPVGAATPSTQATVLLAGQARKFGLGLVLATQAPKGLHNQISGNAGTMIVGRIGVPAQIAAVEEMARARGSSVESVGRLGQGQFYVAVEGSGFRRVRAPLCLSHHPKSPLVPDEVMRRARDKGSPR
jgi:DNA helicase HerA-like ATPase